LQFEAEEVDKLPGDDDDISKASKEEEKTAATGSSDGGAEVKDTEYHDALGVPMRPSQKSKRPITSTPANGTRTRIHRKTPK